MLRQINSRTRLVGTRSQPLPTSLLRSAVQPWSRLVVRVAEKDAEKDVTDAIDSGLGQLAKQILDSDPEARESLKRYEAAMVRLEKAKAANEELDKMFREAQKGAVIGDEEDDRKQKQLADERLAEAEVEAAEKLLRAAELEFAAARSEQQRWSSEANAGGDRIESGKAAAVAALAGALAALPLVSFGSAAEGLSPALSLTSAIASCFLFGVTYRYAVRGDAWNTQLKGGVVAAFGLVRAAGAADALQAAAASGGGSPLSLEVVGPAALYAFQSLLIFGFAAAALEASFQQGLVKRFTQTDSGSQ